jgi:hydroxyacylglutathione hydrolase
MKMLACAAVALGLAFAPAVAEQIDLTLGVEPGTSKTVLQWSGGRPDFQVLRGAAPATAGAPANLRALTAEFEWNDGTARPASGKAFYYLVSEGNLVAGTFPPSWINGASCASEPKIQIAAYNADTFILRESLCTSFEGPFMYLLFGADKVLLEDTGANSSLPLATTVYGIINQWLFDHNKTSIQLIVAHSHAHGDHVACDGQFQGQPNTTVVGLSQTAVAAFFGITSWPTQIVSYDLGGGRILDVLPIPGHHPAHIAFYDRQTSLLLTGDTLYSGRLYISTFSQYVASVQRLVDFIADKPVIHVLGTHIEMTTTPYEDYPMGATVHLNEHVLQLGREHLTELLSAVQGMTAAPHIEEHKDFIVWPF